MRTIRVMAGLTFREAARRKTLLAALLFGLVFLAVFGVGFYFINKDLKSHGDLVPAIAFKEVRNFMLMAGLYVVNFMTLAMAILTSIDTLSGEMASGTIHTVVSKPVRRWEVVLGKWLGFLGMLTLYLLFMAGGVISLVYVISGYEPPDVTSGLLLLWLNGLLLLNVSLFAGSHFSTLTSGVLAFSLYGISFVGGWIEQFGWLAQRPAAVNVGIISSLIFPAEALWKRAAFEMQSPLIKALGISPFSAQSPPNSAMIGYAAGYAALALLLAVYGFSRRDL